MNKETTNIILIDMSTFSFNIKRLTSSGNSTSLLRHSITLNHSHAEINKKQLFYNQLCLLAVNPCLIK